MSMQTDADAPRSKRQPFDSGPLADSGERKAIFVVLDSFRDYRRQTHFNSTHRRRQNFYALHSSHQALLNASPIELLDTLNTIDNAIDDNADIAEAILGLALETLGLLTWTEVIEDPSKMWKGDARPLDMNKAHSTIKQFWRDWSAEGFELEVKPLLNLVLQALSSHLNSTPNKTNILLPGAGLGRLLFELCLAGYNAEGNEISYHQLFASNFILNSTAQANQFKLYPFVTTFNNHLSRQNQLRCVTVPDVHPATEMANRMKLAKTDSTNQYSSPGQMNMTAGDFITSYSSTETSESFGAVVTAYFIDTAPNLIRYIETIRNCLKMQGVWINIGPLLWHFEDRTVEKHAVKTEEEVDDETQNPINGSAGADQDEIGIAEPGSFELTDEEVLALVQSMGFAILSHSMLPSSAGGYMQDPTSMLQNRYNCSHWVARKIS